jgi:hypothetical protein
LVIVWSSNADAQRTVRGVNRSGAANPEKIENCRLQNVRERKERTRSLPASRLKAGEAWSVADPETLLAVRPGNERSPRSRARRETAKMHPPDSAARLPADRRVVPGERPVTASADESGPPAAITAARQSLS